jgi:uncharacterized membrane protein
VQEKSIISLAIFTSTFYEYLILDSMIDFYMYISYKLVIFFIIYLHFHTTNIQQKRSQKVNLNYMVLELENSKYFAPGNLESELKARQV